MNTNLSLDFVNSEILSIYRNLEKSLYDKELNRNGKMSWRYAGALEIYLKMVGVFKGAEPFNYKTSGKKYFFGLIDLTCRETYPKMIYREAGIYLSNNVVCVD